MANTLTIKQQIEADYEGWEDGVTHEQMLLGLALATFGTRNDSAPLRYFGRVSD